MGKTIRNGRNDRDNTPKGQRQRKRRARRSQMRDLLREAQKLSEADLTAFDVALDRSPAAR